MDEQIQSKVIEIKAFTHKIKGFTQVSKNYFFLLSTFYFGYFTKSKMKIKGKRQCGC